MAVVIEAATRFRRPERLRCIEVEPPVAAPQMTPLEAFTAKMNAINALRKPLFTREQESDHG